MYEIVGYFFLKDNEKIDIYKFEAQAAIVSDPDAAHELLKKNGIEHYLITLKEID